MRGIFGWLCNNSVNFDPTIVLNQMGSSISSDHSKISVNSCHIGQAGDEIIASTDQILVAISGHPDYLGQPVSKHNASTLAHDYIKVGDKILEDLKGTFSIAILDSRDNSALIAIDRIGIEPLYFGVNDGTFIFSSQADSLASHPTMSRDLSEQAIFDYLYFHCVPAPLSIYQKQQKLLPAEKIIYKNGNIIREFYWRADYTESKSSFPQLQNECLSLLKESVRKAMGMKKPGAFLSGGTDSTTVVGMLAKLNEQTVRTYSIGFEAEGYDEMEYARISAKHYHAIPNEYYVTPQDVVDAIPIIARAYDEPFGNASAVPTYYCAKLAASDGQDVLLAGDGGDELFAGNARYAHQLKLDMYQKIPHPLRTLLLEPFMRIYPDTSPIKLLNKVKSYIDQARQPMPDRMESYNFLHRIPLDEMFTPTFLERINRGHPLENIRDVYNRTQSNSTLNKMLHLDLKTTLADNDLRKVNRMCETAGIQVRYPMLDQELVEFSAHLPSNLKIKDFKLRFFYKEALKGFLPSETLTKSKQGFGLPFGVWMKEYQPLQDLAYDSLKSLQKREIVKAPYLDNLLEQHKNEHAAYYGVMIWVLMMLEQWLIAHKH